MPAVLDNAYDENRDARRSPVRRLYLVGVVFIAVAIFGAWFATRELRGDQLSGVTQDTNNLAMVLAAQTSRTFQAVDVVLREAQDLAQASGARDAAEFRERVATEEVHRFLVDRLKELPQADALSLIDETGRIVNFTRAWPIPVIDNADRDFYAYWREHDDALPLIGEPIIAKFTGARVLTITRRINGPHGEFRGIALGAVRARYFEDFYEAIRTGEGEATSLFRRDGTLLARYPQLENAIGQKVSSASPWYQVLAAGGGPYVTPGYVGGEPRIISLQPVRDYPLAITVGIAESEALAPWRRQADFIVIGTVGAVAGFAALIWALRRQFQRLEDNEARFRGFATTSSDWFWETDEHHRISYMSEGVSTTGFGIRPRDLIGRTRMEIAASAGSELEKWKEHFTALERHEPFRNFIYTWSNPRGQGSASISGDPLFDVKRHFRGYRGTGRDISPQIRAEHALREAKEAAEAANIAKSQLLANISHELRTPLNAIIGFSEMVDQGLAGPTQPKHREYTKLVLQSGRHLLDVINDILDLARVDAGKFELSEEDNIDLRQVVEACVALTKHRADIGQLTLAVEIEHRLPLIVADPTRLKQVLLNLLSNAIKFTEPGGSATVRAYRAAEGGVALEVNDTGIGMTQAEIEIALEPFGQVDARLAREHEGTGLGLPLTRRLVELHGGTLYVQSEKGRGTTVTVTLPAARVSGVDSAQRPVTGASL
jgi:PAS domain S-box-containing protein